MLPLYGSSPSRRKPFQHHASGKRSLTKSVFFFVAFAFLGIYLAGLCYFGFYAVEKEIQATQATQDGQAVPEAAAAIIKETMHPFHPPSPEHPSFSSNPLWFSSHSMFQSLPSKYTSNMSSEMWSYIEDHRISTRPVVLLGMHRSGTSLLGGLLHHSLHLPVGPPETLIGPAFDNKKGFFENVNVVLQNDDLMRTQRQDYGNVNTFDAVLAAKQLMDLSSGPSVSNKLDFKKGSKALALFRTFKDGFLQKDPRMCLTLPSWFPFFSTPPAIIFTYRHPLQVASSMHTRDPKVFQIARVLKLWIHYNRRAVAASRGLCTVHTSADRVMSDAFGEVTRLRDELRDVCGVEGLAGTVDRKAVDDWVDVRLVHEKGVVGKVAEEVGERGCLWELYESKAEDKRQRADDEKMYRLSMQVFCDLETGVALEAGYVWPKGF